MEEIKKITLVTNDGIKKEVSKDLIMKSGLVKNTIQDFPEGNEIPLNEVKGDILDKILEYMTHYEKEEPQEIANPLKSNDFKKCVSEWDYNFINQELNIVFEIMTAANFMDIPSLLDLCTAKVASFIIGKTSDEIRKTFNLKNDFGPGELEKLLEEHKDALENLKKN